MGTGSLNGGEGGGGRGGVVGVEGRAGGRAPGVLGWGGVKPRHS
jgi:hypothetical protein